MPALRIAFRRTVRLDAANIADVKRTSGSGPEVTRSVRSIKYEQRAEAAWIASVCRAAGRDEANPKGLMVKTK
jgi:4-diphosphocytidyl-2C-methyl-D-erythritol kinase